ncbi:hypothetical protein HUN41_00286 [Streptomyces phage Coruscant]|uniref:Uncharacterized protein n=1 Tax=Streptomyces phage Coruscant TaxID=2739834 RepID=A0A7G4AVW0_9CAUD|nr:hypothetical protein PP454_gp020 [Streptomyces phage Coruscant]YP_010651609.1 hypothetical protein PP454_gp043 [Streptomyces phage Coruscant]QMP84150.1 hypothetical protein HUN41_00020 [Streptomyces phage Coruscant]QMP84374.1 hypothetical protein HUN41_00286 [Streptomyces phage Coruscant]
MQTLKFYKVRKAVAEPVEEANYGKKMKFVNVHLVDRHWGGSEEGGWHFDAGEIMSSIPVPNRRIANAVVRVLENGEFSNKGRKPIWSVNSRGEYRVTVDTKIGSDWSDYRPWE